LGRVSRQHGVGIGFTLGVFISFVCLALDNLIRTWDGARKKLLGIN